MEQVRSAPVDAFASHGGRIDLARAAFPGVARWIDLSTGIAPWAYRLGAMQDAAERLPDPDRLKALEQAAAAFFGADPGRVVAVPGSDLGMRLLALALGRLGAGPRAAIVRPGYSGHEAMWGGQAPQACAIADIAALAETHDALVLARPNNPDGKVADAGALERAAASLAARGGHLIVDEAFADAAADQSLAGTGWPGLIVLRSFGKFFGLAGLRLGFVIAPPPVADRLRAMLGDWPIGGPALEAGLAAYADTAWQQAQRARLADASQRLAALLERHGIGLAGRTAFFALASLTGRDRLFVHLMRAGLLTRPFAHAPDWLRIGLPRDDSDWTRLGDALAAWSDR